MNISWIAFGMPGTTELIVIAVIALLVFGKRLPDVARSVGKSIVEFKKGIRDVKDEIQVQTSLEATPRLEKNAEPAPSTSQQAPADATAPSAPHENPSKTDA